MAMENLNEREELERTTQEVLENLSALKGAPSLTLQDVPPDWATRDAGAAAGCALTYVLLKLRPNTVQKELAEDWSRVAKNEKNRVTRKAFAELCLAKHAELLTF